MVHPFFRKMLSQDQQMIRQLCCNALRSVSLSRGDVLFLPGERAYSMYFVTSGVLLYDDPQNGRENYVFLHTGDWCSEPSLWTTWMHYGRMLAKSECDLLELNA